MPPGTVICLSSGDYDGILIENLRGTAERPVVIRNHGGRVRIVKGELALRNCQHVQLTGTGTPGLTYGIHAYQAWVHVYETPLGIEIDHIEVEDNSLSVKDNTDPDHTVSDVHIHHNYLHCSPGGYQATVMYIGHANYHLHPGQYVMRRVEIDHNIIDGADGRALKVTSIVEGCSVHHNYITNIVRVPDAVDLGRDTAILISRGTRARVFNNIISNSGGRGIVGLDPYFGSLIYNNLIVNTGQHEQYADAFITWDGGYELFNNTIIGVRRHGIAFPESASDNYAFNNIVLDTGGAPIRQGGSPDSNVSHNLTDDDGYASANFGFVDYQKGDYRLTEHCPAVDAGVEPSHRLSFDLDDSPRPVGEYDVGAFEFSGTPSPDVEHQ